MKRLLPVTPILSVCLLLYQPGAAQSAVVQTGKRYVNLTKGVNGRIIEAGDILEIRTTITVGNFSSRTINLIHYVNTIPNTGNLEQLTAGMYILRVQQADRSPYKTCNKTIRNTIETILYP